MTNPYPERACRFRHPAPVPDSCPLCRHYARIGEGASYAGGPGWHLERLLASLGLTPGGCNCEARARQMDLWGVEGCRARRDEILAWLREEQAKRGWAELAGAAWKALSGGLPLSAEGLLDEAIRRAEKGGGG
jgi:IS5 family transposase